jgi:hypothetical protein
LLATMIVPSSFAISSVGRWGCVASASSPVQASGKKMTRTSFSGYFTNWFR